MTLDRSTKPHDRKSQNDCSRTSSLSQPLSVLSFPDGLTWLSVAHRSLGLGVLQDYTKLKADTQAKNIAAWTPVVAEILHGFCKFDDKAVCVSPPIVFKIKHNN
jgi:hypothetical protein